MRNRREIGADIVDVLFRMGTMWKNTEGRSDNAVQTFATSFEPVTPDGHSLISQSNLQLCAVWPEYGPLHTLYPCVCYTFITNFGGHILGCIEADFRYFYD